MNGQKKSIEVCFTPALFPHITTQEPYIVVIVDILRATTSICAAFDNKVEKIIPVPDYETAKNYRSKGYIVASEKEGKVMDFADFGNSPFNFQKKELQGKTIAYCTTNGTKAIEMVKNSHKTLIGSFLNLTALAKFLIKENENIVMLCSGWKNKFNLEDSIFAGALAEKILLSDKFFSHCDSALAAIDLWDISKNDLLKYIEKASHRQRLRRLVLDDVMEYCFTPDSSDVIPAYENNAIVNIG